ncbi:hypothetical protein KCU70_g340, partial [Aureobasidium melanogenum]
MASLSIPTRPLFLAYSRHTHLVPDHLGGLGGTSVNKTIWGNLALPKMFGPRTKTAAPFSRALRPETPYYRGYKRTIGPSIVGPQAHFPGFNQGCIE